MSYAVVTNNIYQLSSHYIDIKINMNDFTVTVQKLQTIYYTVLASHMITTQ